MRREDMVREYLVHLRIERGCSPLTAEAYGADLADFSAFLDRCGIACLGDVERETVVAYEADLLERGYATSSVDRRVSAIKGLFRFLVREGLVRRNPADTLQLPKAPERLPDVLSASQMDELLSAPPAGKWCPFKELNKSDVKDMLTLLCRCVCLALAAGGLIIYLMGKITISDLGIMLCIAVILLSLDRLTR